MSHGLGPFILSRLVELQHLRGYLWDVLKGGFVSKWNGRLVGSATVARKLDNYGRQVVGVNLRGLTERMLEGRLTLPEWQARVAKEIKDAARVSTIIGRGGREMVGKVEWGRMGARLREEYRHLNKFAADIASGQLSNAEILARIQLYSGSTRTFYYDGLLSAKREAGLVAERRRLGIAEHCPDCISMSEEGWMPIGYFPPPGIGSVCRHNCQCDMEYGGAEMLL